MKALGSKYSAKDIKFLIKCADKDENEKMDLEEFCLTATIMVNFHYVTLLLMNQSQNTKVKLKTGIE